MTAQQFLSWMDAAQCRGAADVIRAIGCGRTQAEGWVKAARNGQPLKIKRTVALAMAAVAHGLAPWHEDEGDDDDQE